MIQPHLQNARGAPKVYSVSELTFKIRAVLENEVGDVRVEGEISNFRIPASGHWYFTLKDENAQIACVMFRANQRGLQIRPASGMQLRVCGVLSVYSPSGQYQIIVRALETSGQGALQAAFEALKRRLEAEGLFSPERKRPIPVLPQRIGVVTSPTGAAIRDILNVLARRFGNLHVIIAPVRVQGELAAGEIAAAIDGFNSRRDADVLIVGRGGGSIEDLWSFNDEGVARAIARSEIPVISAIGHETDFTISDFVADLRSPTPSAAAELVIGRKEDFEKHLAEFSRALFRALDRQVSEVRHRLAAALGSYVFREPLHIAQRARDRLEGLPAQLRRRLEDGLRQRQQRLDELGGRLEGALRERHHSGVVSLARLGAALRATNPLAVLSRGYSITFAPGGRVINAAGQVSVGDKITTRVAAGVFKSEVIKK